MLLLVVHEFLAQTGKLAGIYLHNSLFPELGQTQTTGKEEIAT